MINTSMEERTLPPNLVMNGKPNVNLENVSNLVIVIQPAKI